MTAVPDARPAGPRLAAAWWAPGLALHERAGRPGAVRTASVDPGDTFALRFADLGLDEDGLRALRAESPAQLAIRIPRPVWAATAERAVAGAVPPTPAEVAGGWREAFGRVLQPFTDDAVTRIVAGPGASAEWLDLPGVATQAGVGLRRALVDLAVRTLVTELHRWSSGGRLAGADGRDRFVAFVRAVATADGLAELLSGYPVLARLLAQACDATVTATRELLDRLAADRAAVITTLLGGEDPGPVTAVVFGRGDRHAGGRAVAFVDFADGRRVVYKPRDVTTQVVVNRFIDRLGAGHPQLCPRAVRTLVRPGYGWSEWIAARDLADRAEADRFYRRQGALLALLHVLRTTDMHYENVIAHAGTPVLIDTETLFNAELVPSGSRDPAAEMLAASVYRTALLPLIVIGEQGVADLSGLGGDRAGDCPASVVDWLDAGTDRMRLTRRAAAMTGSANRPRIAGVDLDPGDHEPALVAGFRQAYDFITEHRSDFAALVSACAHLEVRVVTRPSWLYATILDETTHPDVLRDALDRDDALSILYAGRLGNPLFAQLITHEIAALWDGDVPMFLASAGSGELRTPDGTRLPVPLPRAGVPAALDTLAALNEVDRHEQEWIISATLATRRNGPAHPSAGTVSRAPGQSSTPVVHPDALLAAARSMADRIVARLTGDRRINWLNLENVDGRWLLLPMGAGLGTGYLGVAVFLAQLSAVTGIGRYAEQARRAVADPVSLVDLFADRPELAEAAGWGALTGLGGVAYGLARLGRLLDDPVLRESAARLAGLANRTAGQITDPGWVSGLAGHLAVMSAVRSDLGLGPAGPAAAEQADRLAEIADRDHGSLPLSFADGLAGIGWALTHFGPGAQHRETGRRVAALVATRGQSVSAPGWCHGRAGLALAAACVPGPLADAQVAALADGPAHLDLSLCHGELGVTEVLGVIAGPLERGSPAAHALRRRTGQVLDVLRRHGPVCGVPGTASNPDLLTGLAGIGYGLLRLAAPGQVPSVLLLQPANGRN